MNRCLCWLTVVAVNFVDSECHIIHLSAYLCHPLSALTFLIVVSMIVLVFSSALWWLLGLLAPSAARLLWFYVFKLRWLSNILLAFGAEFGRFDILIWLWQRLLSFKWRPHFQCWLALNNSLGDGFIEFKWLNRLNFIVLATLIQSLRLLQALLSLAQLLTYWNA